MRATRLILTFALAGTMLGCPAADDTPAPAPEAAEAPAAEGAPAAEEAEPSAAEEAPAAEEAEATGDGAAAEPAAEPAADTFENGVYSSPKFNVRFTLPEGWSASETDGPAGLGTSDDSITFVGPADGLRLVVANSDSIQLVDSSFANLTETIGFENVRIVPDASQARTFNGVPGYRTEADALLRGEPVPQYIIAQALDLPGQPTMFTIFVNGDAYDTHSGTMVAILDSIEAINLRQE